MFVYYQVCSKLSFVVVVVVVLVYISSSTAPVAYLLMTVTQ